MQKKIFYIFLFILVMAIFSCIMPYPILSSFTNINEQDVNQINAYHEIENSNISSQQTKLLNLEFENIDCIIPIGSKFEIINLKTDQSCFVTRVGGKHHFDIEFFDSTTDSKDSFLQDPDAQIDKSIPPFLKTSTSTIAVLIKLNDYCFFPASLSTYQHGYSTTNTLGHYCLHFKDSKLDYSAKCSPLHQNIVEKAKKTGLDYLKRCD